MLLRGLVLLRRCELALAITLLGAIVTAVLLGTIGRFAGYPVIWSDEVAQALFVWLSLLAGDLTLQRAGHFRIDLAVAWLPGTVRRLLDLVIWLMVAAMMVLLIYYGMRLVGITHMRPLPLTRAPSSWATAALPVGFLLMLITLAEQIVRLIRGRDAVTAGPVRDVM